MLDACLLGSLSLLSYGTQDHLPRDGSAHSSLCSLTSVKKISQGWRDGWGLRSIVCPSRELEFDSQNLHDSLQLSVTLVLGDLMPSSVLYGPIDTHRHTHTHEIKINK